MVCLGQEKTKKQGLGTSLGFGFNFIALEEVNFAQLDHMKKTVKGKKTQFGCPK